VVCRFSNLKVAVSAGFSLLQLSALEFIPGVCRGINPPAENGSNLKVAVSAGFSLLQPASAFSPGIYSGGLPGDQSPG